MTKLALTIVTMAVVCSSCSDVSSVSDSTLIVRGKVTTGAHTRTAVSGGYVQTLIPGSTKWTALTNGATSGVPNKAVTQSDGTYTYQVDLTSLAAYPKTPAFVAASDAKGTLTMLAPLPGDVASSGAELSVDINPVTTAASQLLCPGGTSTPPANSWCYSIPTNASADDANLVGELNTSLSGPNSSLDAGTPPNWQTFMSGFLNDPATFGQIKNTLTGAGVTFGSASASTISSAVAAPPVITEPIAGVDDNNSNPTSGAGGGASSCTAVWSCGGSLQCQDTLGAPNGNQTGFSSPGACNTWCQTYVPGNCHCTGC